MKLVTAFLRSKVAHRIVILFVSCALLPIAILAVISLSEVSSQVHEESQMQLKHASKSQAMAIYERLQMLDSDLQVLSAEMDDHPPDRIMQGLKGHFTGLAVYDHKGRQRSRWGTSPALPPLTAVEKQHIGYGNPLLLERPCVSGNGACIIMLRMTDRDKPDSSVVVGELNSEYLWTPENLAAGFQLCVLSSSRSVLYCSDPSMYLSANTSPAFNNASGLYQWEQRGELYDASYWKLLIGPLFGQEPWAIAVSQKHTEALAPMLRFRESFRLVILLSLLVVMFFSMVQIRRTLVPLERLREGTRKIAARQFESRVEVRSSDEFGALASSFNSMAEQLGRQFHTLKTINEIDQAIFSSLDPEAIMDGVLAHMPGLLPSDSFGVCVFDEQRSSCRARFAYVAGGQTDSETRGIPRAEWTHLQDSPAALTLTATDTIPGYLFPLEQAGMESFLILPIRVENSVHALLVCARRKTNGFTPEDISSVRPVADQLAVAFAHVHLIKALEHLHWGTLTALARAIDAKSEWTSGHSERVTNLAIRIGRKVGLTPRDLHIMQMGGLLHDIGKIGTPPEILDKRGRLTADEMKVMKDHVRTGVRILEPIPGFKEALPIVSQHHEWFNGKGYPEGLAGKEISLYARIFAVADCYDALTSDRPYRRGLSPEQAMASICEQSGTQFDPDVIAVFTSIMGDTLYEEQGAFRPALKQQAATTIAGAPTAMTEVSRQS